MLIDVRVVGQTIAVAAALYAWYGVARRPSREGVELAAALSSLAAASFFSSDLSPLGLLFVALGAGLGPYLIVRLSDHFRPAPKWLERLMLLGVVYVAAYGISTVGVVARLEGTLSSLPTLPLPFTLVQPLYQLTGFVYGTAVFVIEARRASGARAWRLRAAALAALLVILSSAALSVAVFVSVRERGIVDPPAWALAMFYLVFPVIALLNLVAFAPPPWLRQMWRLGELRQFLADTAHLSVGERGRETLDALASAAMRATGATRASVALADASGELAPPDEVGREMHEAWSSRAPAFGRHEIAVPIRTTERRYGVLGLSFARPPLFPRDDAEVVQLMAERTVVALANDELFRAQRAFEERERKRAEAELERVDEELRVAREIQQALLPRQLPELPGWRIDAYYQPAREVGGDFYDVFPLEGDRFAVVVGDASGKGIPAALLMATTRTILRATSSTTSSPGALLAAANEVLSRAVPASMFVTCMVVVVEPASGRMRYANAGHDVAYLRSGGSVEEVRARGMPLGLMPGSTYEEAEGAAPVGSTLVLYSDGIVEAHAAPREMFGFPRMRALVGRADGDVIGDVLRELHAFTPAGWEQEDDITIVTARRLS